MIHSHQQSVFQIDEPTQVAAARRGGADLAQRLGFDDTLAGRVALVITEAATNIVKHAGRGQILLRGLSSGGALGIEVLAIDAGPGMANLSLNMEDGNSTAGSYGVGLGAMRRQSDDFDVYTAPGAGTALCLRLWNGSGDARAACEVGAVCRAMPGEEACGDAWTIVESAGCLSVLVADGLGHGPLAAQASQAAVRVTQAHPDSAPAELMQDVHGALRATRGAAVALARLDIHARSLQFAGIGNIAASVHETDARRHLVSHNGIVGANLRKVQEFGSAWPPGALLILHSDGIGTRWSLDAYPGLAARHPSLIAAVLYRDFARDRDDATIVVIRGH